MSATHDEPEPDRDEADRDARFRAGVAAYAAGEHYEAHEHWEELWLVEDDDDRRTFLQALIQLTSAIHKVRHRVAARGAPNLLARAAEKLARVRGQHWGIDPVALAAAVRALQGAAEQAVAAGSDRLDDALLPRLG